FDGGRHDCGDKTGFVIANLALALQREDVAPAVRVFLARDEWRALSSSSTEQCVGSASRRPPLIAAPVSCGSISKGGRKPTSPFSRPSRTFPMWPRVRWRRPRRGRAAIGSTTVPSSICAVPATSTPKIRIGWSRSASGSAGRGSLLLAAGGLALPPKSWALWRGGRFSISEDRL